jgi:CMP/dCMP kinase
MGKKLVITIDGPAGAGKSTVSKALAKRLGYIYLDTGALYRALAYKTLNAKIRFDDNAGIADLCVNTRITLNNIDGQMKVYVDGEDVGDKIRTEEVGLIASQISKLVVVRQSLLCLQREAAKKSGIVAEGRDMGSVVFPNADYKFYLDANFEERIQRRHKELLGKGISSEYQKIKKDMQARDKQDSEREIAPLRPTRDSIVIDSTGMSVAKVVDKILTLISES